MVGRRPHAANTSLEEAAKVAGSNPAWPTSILDENAEITDICISNQGYRVLANLRLFVPKNTCCILN
jgi:hypothetical protein